MCVETGVKKQLSKGKVWNVKSCKCKRGYVGNGITCADEKTGIHKIRIDWIKILKFFFFHTKKHVQNSYQLLLTGIVTRPGVEVKTKLTTDVWEQYKLDTTVEVEGNDDFMNSLDKLLKGGSCGAGCAADVVTCPA